MRVLLVDNHMIVRQGLEAILDKEPDVEVVGHAADGRFAVELTARLKPDITIMAIDIPEMNGIAATRKITSCGISTEVLILTKYGQRDIIIEALRAGAKGYIVKKSPMQEVPRAISAIRTGELYICGHAARSLDDGRLNRASALETPPRVLLSSREQQLLKYMADGLTIREIAGFLQQSTKTIVTCRSKLMQKLGVKGIPGLVKFAVRKGITC